MKSAIIAAIVAAVVASGSALATTRISGRSIRPHSIPLNRLAHKPVGKRGLRGLQGPQGIAGRGAVGPTGAAGPRGPVGATGKSGNGISSVSFDPALCSLSGGYTLSFLTVFDPITVCNGGTGATGLQGIQGPQGETGPAGADGAPGTDCSGQTPIAPARTCPGATGAQGPQGLAGANGQSVTSASLTSATGPCTTASHGVYGSSFTGVSGTTYACTGPQGAAAALSISQKSATYTVLPGDTQDLWTSCAGGYVVDGGYFPPSISDYPAAAYTVIGEGPENQGWSVWIQNNATTTSLSITVEAICATLN